MSVVDQPSSTVCAPVSLESLRAAIAEVRGQLLQHPLYRDVDTLPRLRGFMGQHVFAV